MTSLTMVYVVYVGAILFTYFGRFFYPNHLSYNMRVLYNPLNNLSNLIWFTVGDYDTVFIEGGIPFFIGLVVANLVVIIHF